MVEFSWNFATIITSLRKYLIIYFFNGQGVQKISHGVRKCNVLTVGWVGLSKVIILLSWIEYGLNHAGLGCVF